MKRIIFLQMLFFVITFCNAQSDKSKGNELFPVRGLAIAAPSPGGLESFLRFIENDLVPAKFNLLILRVDWKYNYQSRPELVDSGALTKEQVKKIVELCKKNKIDLVPQINLLGHQSWAKTTNALLRAYPQFDETPHIKTENYTGWPNPDGLYCKSYCPLHPDVHKVVFDVVDEIMEVFEAGYFHAGMDEVFYIGHEKCPRCRGRDKAELFAGEVNKIRNHLAQNNRKLMIWGDRLIDGKTTGMGEWEASMNHTHRAIDMIAKDVFICDWHYERPDQTAVYFAMKGFDVATCPWRTPEIALQQVDDMMRFRKNSSKEMSSRFRGIIATVWSGADQFLNKFNNPAIDTTALSDAKTVRRLMERYKKM